MGIRIIDAKLAKAADDQLLIQQAVRARLGLFYERKRGEARSNRRARAETIDSEKAGQALFSHQKKVADCQPRSKISNIRG
jgi:hypothetical protein